MIISKHRPSGFSIIIILLAASFIGLIGLTSWYIWQGNRQPAATRQYGESTTHLRWVSYTNKEMGFELTYPKTWTISQPRIVSTMKGEKGLTISLAVDNPQVGDPNVNISVYPPSASIKDVDPGANDLKVQDITTADKKTITIVGTIEDPSQVTKPTQMYISSCWPRNCTPRLLSGKFWSANIGSTSQSCPRDVVCPTEINTHSRNYTTLLQILQSIQSTE